MKIILSLLIMLFAAPTFACIDIQYKTLNCEDTFGDETFSFQLKNLKLTKTSLSFTDPNGEKVRIDIPSTMKDTDPTWVTKFYCEGQRLVIEENVLGLNAKEYYTMSNDGIQTSGETAIVFENGDGSYEAETIPANTTCTVKN